MTDSRLESIIAEMCEADAYARAIAAERGISCPACESELAIERLESVRNRPG
jgi:hypothetical protein